ADLALTSSICFCASASSAGTAAGSDPSALSGASMNRPASSAYSPNTDASRTIMYDAFSSGTNESMRSSPLSIGSTGIGSGALSATGLGSSAFFSSVLASSVLASSLAAAGASSVLPVASLILLQPGAAAVDAKNTRESGTAMPQRLVGSMTRSIQRRCLPR